MAIAAEYASRDTGVGIRGLDRRETACLDADDLMDVAMRQPRAG